MLQTLTRRLIKQKARHHPRRGSDTLSAHGFRIYFTPLTAVLFTFPSRYLFAIGRQLVFSLTPWSARIHATFHVCGTTQESCRFHQVFGHGPLTLFGMLFHTLNLTIRIPRSGPTTPHPKDGVWAVPLSLAATYGITSFSFPPLTEMFHFSGFRELTPILFRVRRSSITLIRLPHSEISGSKRICRSPKLIAAYHVLHRLLAPRHPPYALTSLFHSF